MYSVYIKPATSNQLPDSSSICSCTQTGVNLLGFQLIMQLLNGRAFLSPAVSEAALKAQLNGETATCRDNQWLVKMMPAIPYDIHITVIHSKDMNTVLPMTKPSTSCSLFKHSVPQLEGENSRTDMAAHAHCCREKDMLQREVKV